MHPAPAYLHIPDGFLSTGVAAVGWVLAAGLIAAALRHTRRHLGERQVPLMGLLAAFIFAAQAVNFPVAAGTSGHLIGATLAAIVVGPWAAMLIMTAVISVQGLLFQDGGLLAMGWNLINMGALAAFSGALVYRAAVGWLARAGGARIGAAFAAAWVSVEAGAIATAVELAASGTTPLGLGLPAMAFVHAFIGLGEGLITAGAVAVLGASRPEVLQQGELAPGRRSAAFVVGAAGLTLLVVLMSPLASIRPDGLNSVAAAQGFAGRAQASPFDFLEGYRIPQLSNPAVATIGAVLIGSVVVLAAGAALGWVARKRFPGG